MNYRIYTAREPVKQYYGRAMEIADGSYGAGEVYILAESSEEALGLLASWITEVEWFLDKPEEDTINLRLEVYEVDDSGEYDILKLAGTAELLYEHGAWWLRGGIDWIKYEVLKCPERIVIQRQA